jgi:ketosteroid isomerase-like protein
MTTSEPATESAALRAFREGHQAFVQAFNEGDFERASRGLREDYVQHFPPGFTETTLRGRDAWRSFFEEFRETVQDWRLAPFEYIEAEPRCFVVGTENAGVGRVSGLSAAMRVWDVIELDEDNRAWRAREFTDRDEALAAAEITDKGGGAE